MEKILVDFLNKCRTSYSSGEIYISNNEEFKFLKNKFGVEAKEITDEIYDIIYDQANKEYPTHELFKELTSENLGYGQDIIHDEPYGSMTELKTGDWDKWKTNHNEYYCSDKLDGCSIILKYQDGKLISAATRGGGTVGKDIMRHIKYVSNIPLDLKTVGTLVVRGELLFPKDKIPEILKHIEETTGKTQKNGRNTISGALTKKETNQYIFNNAHFVAYWTSVDHGHAFYNLERLGFEIPHIEVISKNISEEEMIEKVKIHKEKSNYELDGVILTQKENEEEGYETGTINPKASRKFKMGIYDDTNVCESIVTNVNWQISRYGTFTPVIEIEPKEVSGCTVTNITGHNYENIVKKQCGIGSKIKFCRAGLVIPYLMEVLTPSNNFNLPKIATKIRGVDLILDNSDINEYTIEMDIQQMVHFGRSLEVDQMGYGNCAKIVAECMKKGAHLDIIGFLYLLDGSIAKILGKNGEKLEASLMTKKTAFTEPKLASALSSFGEGLGERVLNTVFDKYNTLIVTKEQLEQLEGFGEVRINQYLDYVDNWSNTRNTLLELGWKFKTTQSKESNKFETINACFSGVRDKELISFINNNGGKAGDNWNKNVNLLIVKDKNAISSKIEKAKENNIQILTLEEAKDKFYNN